MKVSPKADYPVRVVPEPEERPGQAAHLFTGIYRVILNHMINVVFVPDVSQAVPPWDTRKLPSTVETAAQARLETVLLERYVVTPNQTLAGSDERFEWPADDDGYRRAGVVFCVAPAEFDGYAEDLAELSEIVFSRTSKETVSDLRRFAVVPFLERRVVASRWLERGDAVMLGRPA